VKQYVALDCSLKQISVCVMTEQRRVIREAVIAADAGSIAEFFWSQAPEAELIGLECGPSSAWLFCSRTRCVRPHGGFDSVGLLHLMSSSVRRRRSDRPILSAFGPLLAAELCTGRSRSSKMRGKTPNGRRS
jgi:hypothetical protein